MGDIIESGHPYNDNREKTRYIHLNICGDEG